MAPTQRSDDLSQVRDWRSHIMQIFEGTNQIQRLVISRGLATHTGRK